MNAPTNKPTAMLLATLLLGLGASALADSGAPIQPTTPQVTLQAQPAPTARPTLSKPGQADAPGQRGPRGGHGSRGAGPGQMTPCAPGAGMVMRPAAGGSNTTGRALPTPPISGTVMPGTTAQPTLPTPGTTAAQPPASKAPKGDKMDGRMGPKDKGMGKGDKGGKGEVCPPAPKGMEQGKLQPGAAAPGQATANQTAPAVRDLGRLDALAAQTSEARIRGYLNDARTYLQSADKAQQKAGRNLLHAAEALVQGNQTPRR